MEGLLDFVLRDVLTRIGGVDRCVSEFIRITNTLLPERVFIRHVPELLNHSCTPAGVPVRPQLLGSDPVCLAENAAQLANLRPAGIDLNFGCPAKVVNRHGGGAALLDNPELLHAIALAVRRAVPASIVVSAKMRLGFNDGSRALECAQALAAGGADEIVVHARTKVDGYRPPAYWEQIAPIRAALPIPIIANGEIWNAADAQRCQQISGCEQLMLGRGMVAYPGLAHAIKANASSLITQTSDAENSALKWEALYPYMHYFWRIVCQNLTPKQKAGRFKQWLFLLRRHYPQAQSSYVELRTATEQEITTWLAQLHTNLPAFNTSVTDY